MDKVGIQIILFRLGVRKGVGITRVEYLSKDTDTVRKRAAGKESGREMGKVGREKREKLGDTWGREE